jgi:hypothetical protein
MTEQLTHVMRNIGLCINIFLKNNVNEIMVSG